MKNFLIRIATSLIVAGATMSVAHAGAPKANKAGVVGAAMMKCSV